MKIMFARISLISLILSSLQKLQKFFLALLESGEQFYKRYKWVLRELLLTQCQSLKALLLPFISFKHFYQLYQIVLIQCVLDWLQHSAIHSSQVKSTMVIRQCLPTPLLTNALPSTLINECLPLKAFLFLDSCQVFNCSIYKMLKIKYTV